MKLRFMPRYQSATKAKRTFSLSRKTVAFLEAERKARRQKSLSAVLEEIVRRHQEEREMERVSASITRYYDTISEEERAENLAWAKFAETQFPNKD
jgi:hypothetical protein